MGCSPCKICKKSEEQIRRRNLRRRKTNIDKEKRFQNPCILLIGIAEYDEKWLNDPDNRKYNLKQLNGVKTDIKDLKKIFTKLKFQNIFTIQKYIKSKKVKNQKPWSATKKDMINFCIKYRTHIHENELKDNIDSLIVYFSGHGAQNDWLIDSNGEQISLFQIKCLFNDCEP
eukprot:507498_1